MIWHPAKQGTPEWLDARLGIPTASCFEKILSPKRLEPSTQATRYRNQLVAERILRMPVVDAGSLWMERGSALEREACNWYAFDRGTEPTECGLALTDDGRIGASPDRLVGEDGLLEVKCPSAAVHIGYLLDGVDADYRLQVNGQLWVTGRRWLDFLSYCPGFPPVLVRINPEKAVQEALGAALPVFANAVDEAAARIVAMMSTKEVAA